MVMYSRKYSCCPSRAIAVCLLGFVFLFPRAAMGQSAATDEAVRSIMKQENLSAISVTITRNGKVVYESAYGFADREKGLKAAPTTPFYIASVSKALTGTALILLEAQHKIDLDRSVNEYLPGAKLWSPMWDANAATIRRVANHTGGLTTYSRDCAPNSDNCKASIETAIARYGILFWPPGDHFDYSNLGYGVLGVVIANVSHKSLDDFLSSALFQPLQMKDCYLPLAGQLHPASGRNYDHDQNLTPVLVSETPAASAIRCSTHDLAVLGSFVLADKIPGQQQILTEAQLRELVSSVSASGGEQYSFGWKQNEINGTLGVFAQGGTYDSFALLQLIPSEHIAIAVISNTGSATLMSDVMAKLVTPLFPKGHSSISGEAKGSTAPSGQMSGRWSGVVRTWNGDVPIRADITQAHGIEITLGTGNGPAEHCEQANIDGLHFYCVVHGNLGTPDGPTPPYPIEIELFLHGERLTGAAVTDGYPQLPYWAELNRVAQNNR